MNLRTRLSLNALILKALIPCLCLSGLVARAEERPISGDSVPGFDPIDTVILEFMDTVGCQAATVAVSKDQRLLYSRGYGWSDERRQKPVRPDALMRIASITKPVTAAAVRNAIRAGQVSLDTRAFELIDVRPRGGTIADPRIHDITVAHLLDHKGGWDREASFDPMFHDQQIRKELRLRGPVTPIQVIEYMLTKPLQFTPGENVAYSNFGYCVLGRVLEKVTRKRYDECIQQSVFRPLGITDIRTGSSVLKKRHPREVWYPVGVNAFSLDVMDSHGGLIASAPALCEFLQAYWIGGDPRLPGQRGNWTFFGSLPGTTAMVRQREDGVNVAVLFNGRRDATLNQDNDSLRQSMDQAITDVLTATSPDLRTAPSEGLIRPD